MVLVEMILLFLFFVPMLGIWRGYLWKASLGTREAVYYLPTFARIQSGCGRYSCNAESKQKEMAADRI